MSHRLVTVGMDVGVVVGTAAADTANASADAGADTGANVAADAAAADEATAGAGVEDAAAVGADIDAEDAAAAAADDEDDDDDDEPPSPRHHPDLLRQVLLLVAAHGHTREAAAATLAVRDLHRDGELLALTALVATRAGGETLLMRAVRRGDAARAGELLRACLTRASRAALLAAADATGATPLTRAATGAVVRELLRAGATAPATPGVGARDDGLAWAVSAGRLVLVEALLEALPLAGRAARLNAVDDAGRTLLHRARKRSVAQLLLDAGAERADWLDMDDWDAVDQLDSETGDQARPDFGELDDEMSDQQRQELRRRVNLASESGATLLMLPQGAYDASDLLDMGADLLAVNDEGRDAFDYAMDYAVDPDKDEDYGSLHELLDRLPSAAARRQRVNRPDVHGRTLLMRATFDTVGGLLRAGADVWAVDADGHDALWHALIAEWGHVRDAVPFLLAALGDTERRRAWVNRADAAGITPLMCVRSPDSAKALLKAGADLAAVDHAGLDAFEHVKINCGEMDDTDWYVHAVFIKSVPSQKERFRLMLKHDCILDEYHTDRRARRKYDPYADG